MRRFIFALGLTVCMLQSCLGDGGGWIPVRIVNIEYPLLALQSGTEGDVVIDCSVAPDGSVQSAKIISGSPLLGGAVLGRIGEWRFRNESNRAMALSPKLVFRFVLEKRPVVKPTTKFVFDYPATATITSQPLRRTH